MWCTRACMYCTAVKYDSRQPRGPGGFGDEPLALRETSTPYGFEWTVSPTRDWIVIIYFYIFSVRMLIQYPRR